MNEVVTTVLFDGQFWIALIEKIDAQGRISIGKYVFGAEPTNTDLLAFYQNRYSFIQTAESNVKIRVTKKKKIQEENRSTNKSREAYKEIQQARCTERKIYKRQHIQAIKDEAYRKRQMKKKDKHKGH